jgi:hypothetical protein
VARCALAKTRQPQDLSGAVIAQHLFRRLVPPTVQGEAVGAFACSRICSRTNYNYLDAAGQDSTGFETLAAHSVDRPFALPIHLLIC